MSPLKKGQKLTDNPKNVSLNLRLTKEEADNIQYCADKLGTNRTAAINIAIGYLLYELENGLRNMDDACELSREEIENMLESHEEKLKNAKTDFEKFYLGISIQCLKKELEKGD